MSEVKRHSLDECEHDAIVLAGVVQALELLDHDGKEYEAARAGVTDAALRMANRLAEDLSSLAV